LREARIFEEDEDTCCIGSDWMDMCPQINRRLLIDEEDIQPLSKGEGVGEHMFRERASQVIRNY
jgi:hypothetical protein